MKLKAGHEQQFFEAVKAASSVAHGWLGWRGQARLFVCLGFDKMVGIHRGNKRLRTKRMKRIIQQCFIDSVMEHVE